MEVDVPCQGNTSQLQVNSEPEIGNTNHAGVGVACQGSELQSKKDNIPETGDSPVGPARKSPGAKCSSAHHEFAGSKENAYIPGAEDEDSDEDFDGADFGMDMGKDQLVEGGVGGPGCQVISFELFSLDLLLQVWSDCPHPRCCPYSRKAPPCPRTGFAGTISGYFRAPSFSSLSEDPAASAGYSSPPGSPCINPSYPTASSSLPTTPSVAQPQLLALPPPDLLQTMDQTALDELRAENAVRDQKLDAMSQQLEKLLQALGGNTQPTSSTTPASTTNPSPTPGVASSTPDPNIPWPGPTFSAPQARPAPLSSFNGDCSKGRDWFNTAIIYLKAHAAMDNQQKINFLLTHFQEGRAKDFAQAVTNHEQRCNTPCFPSFQAFMAHAQANFYEIRLEQSAFLDLNGNTFFQRKCTIREYIDSFKVLIHRANMDVEITLNNPTTSPEVLDMARKTARQVVMYFRCGLNPSIQDCVARSSDIPSDWDIAGWKTAAENYALVMPVPTTSETG
ncbi:hypothetical protein BDV98DRAFT_598682 [Pterulicium gracile]|uniref:Retrotransposon gag domain-containing protein n=1 Tax=Pterulicium gracile TaxID=1884261 RepID=A0A5C3Q540_9AGAR|nr:hypothetical protein BDV98DRAFT_598682 [Pterula gracilis]